MMHAAGDDNDAIRLRGLIASCSGAPGCASAKRWRSPRATLTCTAARFWSATAKAANVAKSGWTDGGGAPFQRTLNGASPLNVALPLSVLVAWLNTLDVPTYPAPCRHVPGREPTYGVKFK